VVVDPSRPGSVLKLAVRQEGFAWWVARLGCPPTDLSAAVRDGWLELAVRGAVGDEEFRLGVTDGQARPELAALPLRRGPLGATGWRTVRVTLAALAVENPRLDWSRVAGVVLTSAHGRPLTLWLTAVKLVN
jgi:hypothetical protein